MFLSIFLAHIGAWLREMAALLRSIKKKEIESRSAKQNFLEGVSRIKAKLVGDDEFVRTCAYCLKNPLSAEMLMLNSKGEKTNIIEEACETILVKREASLGISLQRAELNMIVDNQDESLDEPSFCDKEDEREVEVDVNNDFEMRV